jgi:hypothetical protein
MKAIERESEAMAEKMMQNLSPELREQIEAMENEDKMQHTGTIKATGNSKNIHGFDCKEYLLEEENAFTVIWATEDQRGLEEDMKKMAERMKAIFPSDDEDQPDEWDLVPGMVPIEYRHLNMDMMMGTPQMEIRIINKISQTKPPAEKFRVPGEAEGFTRKSMKNFMQDMMGGFQN